MEEKTPFGKEANLTGERGTLVLGCPVFASGTGLSIFAKDHFHERALAL